MPGTDARVRSSGTRFDRPVFWLTAQWRFRTAFPQEYLQWLFWFGSLADYSGGPATDSHRFPSARSHQENELPVERMHGVI
jgi:hypothetical protein